MPQTASVNTLYNTVIGKQSKSIAGMFNIRLSEISRGSMIGLQILLFKNRAQELICEFKKV